MATKQSTNGRPGQSQTPHPHYSDAELAGKLMRRQAALSLRVAAVFLFLIVAVPLANQFAPAWSQQPVLGFPLSWFLLGILFYPITWALSTYFVRASEKLEAEEAAMLRSERSGGRA